MRSYFQLSEFHQISGVPLCWTSFLPANKINFSVAETNVKHFEAENKECIGNANVSICLQQFGRNNQSFMQ